jgi:hypothetical protein
MPRRYDDTPADIAARKARREAALADAKVRFPVGSVALYPEMSCVGIVTGYEFNFVGRLLVILDGRGPEGNKGGTCAYPGELRKVPHAVYLAAKERRALAELDGPPDYYDVALELEEAPEDL